MTFLIQGHIRAVRAIFQICLKNFGQIYNMQLFAQIIAYYCYIGEHFILIVKTRSYTQNKQEKMKHDHGVHLIFLEISYICVLYARPMY